MAGIGGSGQTFERWEKKGSRRIFGRVARHERAVASNRDGPYASRTVACALAAMIVPDLLDGLFEQQRGDTDLLNRVSDRDDAVIDQKQGFEVERADI